MIKGLGIDAVEIDRIERVHRRYGHRFLERLFSAKEIEALSRRTDLIPHLAGRFAAKEACLKALGTGWSEGMRWKDIVVLADSGGRPVVELRGEAARRSRQLSVSIIHCSITHTTATASAVVIIE